MRDQEVQTNEHVAKPPPVFFSFAKHFSSHRKAATGHACAWSLS